ncbi:MAG: serine/threonine protein kinase [Labilithrix sp.]|nr:serine/threonine protein kinase [Labilithrix sp.]
MAEVLPSDELIEEPSDYGSMEPGTRLGRYELLVPIARGGMARVWAARLHGQRGFQKLVAIKTILPHLAEEPEFERMFLDEARIASGVHHPNVCEIYELGEEKHTLYLAMEWVSGDSLARVLRASGTTEAVDARVVARIVADACAGLHAAHELTDEDGRALGVVHRDLSPHNILLTSDGTAKVADFGVAKALGQLHEATSAGQLKGKIAYMAPEQVTGNGIDRRSDVFSLGCVLYEATTGQRPFRGDGDHQVMHAVLKGEFALPTSLIRGYPQELERIVMRALSPQPILRYPTAERMRFALEEFLSGAPRGQLVTQSNVGQLVRARIGEQIDRRKERIRQASSAGDREGGWSEPPGGMTPSNQAQGGGHRSGVKPSGAHAAKPLYTTMQMERPPTTSAPPPLPPMNVATGPSSSTTIPQAPAHHPFAQQHVEQVSRTPVSHPGASHSQARSYPSYPSFPAQGSHASHPAHSPPPPPVGHPLAQTALMPPVMSMPPGIDLPGAGGAPPTAAQMRPFTVPPTSSVPPASLPLHLQQLHQQMHMQGQPPVSIASLPPRMQAPPDPAQRPSTPPAGAGQYIIAIAVGVLLAVLIGVGGFLAMRGRHPPPATMTTTPDTTTGVTPVPVPVPVASTTAAATATASADVIFRVVPADATLAVDGRDLAADLRTIPRPPMGSTVTVVARAKGYDDVTVLVDYFTTSPLELTLKPAGAAAAVPPAGPAGAVPPVADPAPPAVTGAQGAATAEAPKDPPKDPPKPRPRQPARDPALPPNPF